MPFVRPALRALDRLAATLGRVPHKAPHLASGSRGEEEAYFYLRKLGYTIVARNFRTPHHKGEIDLIGWDGEVLCFIEVKTRASRHIAPAEAAVDKEKRDNLHRVARDYLRRIGSQPSFRFDVLSIYCENKGTPLDVTLFRDAFA